MKFLRFKLFALSLSAGLILSLAWPERGFAGLLFIGFVPFLWMEELVSRNIEKFSRVSVLLYSFPGFLLWNGLTTWWIVNSTGEGAILAVSLNALFMSIVFSLFHNVKRRLKFKPAGYLALVSFWIMFEYLHLNWDLNWPWLNLGNGFASYYRWVQWYEYTGAIGGTLWVLLGNILIFHCLATSLARYLNFRYFAISLFILFPIGISYLIYYTYKEKPNPVSAVIIQPNIDPYSEQYVLPPPAVVGRIMNLARPLLDSSVNILVTPESAIQEEMWENDLNTFASISLVRQIVSQYPRLNIIAGGSTYYAFRPGEKVPHTARKFTRMDAWYNRYNTSIMVNALPDLQLYHKSKLTPGVEILPSYDGFKWLEKYAIDLGGIVGSLGTDSVRKVYRTVKSVPVAACICYESVFGKFFSGFVLNGAQVMCIITNDGWWGNTAGYRQHFAFSHLRAIETRRCILRSANTGISAFIDQRGDAHGQTSYWVPAAIKATVNANSSLTFYTRHGDYLAVWFCWLGALLWVGSLIPVFKKAFNFRKNLT